MGGGADGGDEAGGGGDPDEGQRPHAAGDDGRGIGGGDEEDVPELQEGHRSEDPKGGGDGEGCVRCLWKEKESTQWDLNPQSLAP